MATELLPKGFTTEASDPFTLAEGDVARLVLTGGNVDMVGVIHIQIKVAATGNDIEDWSIVTQLTGPDWRALDLTGPGDFRVKRYKNFVNEKNPMGVVRI